MSLRTATASQANGPGKGAQHTDAPGAGPRVKRWTDAAVTRCKARGRAITARSTGRSLPSRLEALKRDVSGWLHYVGHSHR